jgi:hypothetical protein
MLKECSFDHDHLTGKVRGLLCLGCNSTLGHAKDSTKILLNLVKYLNEIKPELADYSNVVEVNFSKKAG